jgi:AraC-like DNA-binding protein
MLESIVPILVDIAEKEGISQDSLFQDSGIEFVSGMPVTLTSGQIDIICANAVRQSNNRLLGLEVGTKLDLLSLGIFGYALMSSSRVIDSLKLLLKYSKLLLPSVQITVTNHEHVLDLQASAPQLPTLLEQFYIDLLFAASLNNLHILTGHHQTDTPIELTYDQPLDRTFHTQVYGSRVFFNAGRYAITLDQQILQMPLSSSNPATEIIFRRECDRLMRSDNKLGIVSEKVKQILFSARLDFPTCARVAKQLFMSESTLQRRLAAEGVRYQELLDQVRYKLALEYLQKTTLPISEISLLLGYSNPANFRRTFKRWSGQKPSQVRDTTQEH